MLDALCRGNDARITAIPIGNHFCPSLRLANDGVHRAVFVLAIAGIVCLQQVIEAIPLRFRL